MMVDFQAAATGVGDGPAVRPHLLLFNNRHTHGILGGGGQRLRAGHSGGHRQVVRSVRVGEQAQSLRQHARRRPVRGG
jgi:hypothetical protein